MILTEMPVALEKASQKNDKERFKIEIEKYFMALKDNIVSDNQPKSYSLKNVRNVKINKGQGYPTISFDVQDEDGDIRNVIVGVPDKDPKDIDDFEIYLDGKKYSPSHGNIKLGASYIQLSIANLLKKKVPTKRQEKRAVQVTSDEDFMKKLISKSDKKKNYQKIKEALDLALQKKLKQVFLQQRIVSTLSRVPKKDGYTQTITFTAKINPEYSIETIKSYIKDILIKNNVYNLVEQISSIERGEFQQIFIDIKDDK